MRPSGGSGSRSPSCRWRRPRAASPSGTRRCSRRSALHPARCRSLPQQAWRTYPSEPPCTDDLAAAVFTYWKRSAAILNDVRCFCKREPPAWSAALCARDSRSEFLRRKFTYRLGDDAAPAVEVIRLGKADQTVGVVDRAASRPERDVVDVMAFEEPVRVRAEVVHVEPDEDDLAPVQAGRLRQPGGLGTAGRAPGRPEVEDGREAS